MTTHKKNQSNKATADKTKNAKVNPAPAQAPVSEVQPTTAEPLALIPETATATDCPAVAEQTHDATQTVQASEEKLPTLMLDMTLIRTSPYNPRKSYDKQGIRELADTLNEVGLIQPIRVRVVSGHYEIVCGERRYHAAVLLKWKQIEGYICDVTDEVARDMALTENLQREDMPPMDEAAAYLGLVSEGKDIYTLAAKYGKSDRYIYDRLKLNELVPEVADLLNRRMIGIGIALEISKCEKHIQKDLYENRLKGKGEQDNDPTIGWRGKGVTDFKNLLKDTYTTDLERYNFDKVECRSCAHNTNTYDLFAADCTTCGHCTNEKCLKAKNDAYVLAKATALLKDTPRAVLGKSPYDYRNGVADKLSEQGHECKGLGYNYNSFPTMPTAPDKSRFEDEKKFEEAEKRYGKDLKEYEKETEKINKLVDAGQARVFVHAQDKDAELVYKQINKREIDPDLVKRLTEQKAANLEKAFEKTVEDTRALVRDNSEPAAPFTSFEENALYFVMLDALKRKHYKLMDGKMSEYGRFSSSQKLAIVSKLTPEQKDIIRRDYIAAYLCQGYTDKIDRQMICEYAHMHYPDQFGLIKARHDEVYENRNNRLDERIAEHIAKEKVRAEQAEKKAAKDTQPAEEKKPKANKGGKATPKAAEPGQLAA